MAGLAVKGSLRDKLMVRGKLGEAWSGCRTGVCPRAPVQKQSFVVVASRDFPAARYQWQGHGTAIFQILGRALTSGGQTGLFISQQARTYRFYAASNRDSGE
jgi:hypothetical protein